MEVAVSEVATLKGAKAAEAKVAALNWTKDAGAGATAAVKVTTEEEDVAILM